MPVRPDAPHRDRRADAPIVRLLLLLVFLVLLGFAPTLAVRAQTLAWANRYDGPAGGNLSDYVYTNQCMAIDAQGNMYVAGTSLGDATSYDWVTIKYDTSGHQLWATRYNGAMNRSDSAYALVLDGRGGVYVTGDTNETYGQNVNTLTTIKYSSANGQQVWKANYRALSAGQYSGGEAIAVNPAQPGSVYVTGYVVNGASATSSYDYLTVRYDAGSGAVRWTATYNGPSTFDDIALALAVDASGNCYVTGVSNPATNTGDFLTVKYAATTGAALWTQRYDGPAHANDSAKQIALDPQNNVIVTGYSDDGTDTGIDYTTIKYNGATGSPMWNQRYDGPKHLTDVPYALAVDTAGNVYVTGQSNGGDPTTGGTGVDFATLKYEGQAGGLLWARRYDGGLTSDTTNREDYVRGLALDKQGNVYVTGSSRGTAGGQPAQHGVETIAYNTDGAVLWARRYDTTDTTGNTPIYNDDFGNAIAVDPQGNIYVAGYESNASNVADILALKYNVASLWHAQDIAVGNDNKTRILWSRTDGQIALWTVTAAGVIETSNTFGPYDNVTPRAIAVGADNKVRLLWESGNGVADSAIVWTLKTDLSATESAYTFNANGYFPRAIAVSPTDGKTRIAWSDVNHRVALWTLTGGTISQSVVFNAPTGGYADRSFAVGADNRMRLLWETVRPFTAALWTLNASTPSTIDTGYTYGPLSPVSLGWLASDLAVGADNKPRLLWTNDNAQAAVWQIAAASSTIEKGFTFGPLPSPGWYPDRISYSGGSGSDGNVRLLWTSATGAALLYTVNPTTGAVVTTTGFGPL